MWFPREPIPEKYRVKYLKRDEVIKRLKNGERIHEFWSFRFTNHSVRFENDRHTKTVHHRTFESLKKLLKLKILEERSQSKFWGLKNQ